MGKQRKKNNAIKSTSQDCSIVDIRKLQNDIIKDIQRVAATLNASVLNEEEYARHGGAYPLSVFDEYEDEIGSFANNAGLTGVKYKE